MPEAAFSGVMTKARGPKILLATHDWSFKLVM